MVTANNKEYIMIFFILADMLLYRLEMKMFVWFNISCHSECNEESSSLSIVRLQIAEDPFAVAQDDKNYDG